MNRRETYSALNVEHAAIAPAVLVVSDQSTLGISRESGLSSTGQTEEQGNVAIGTLVGGGVEGKDVVLDGHLVEENCEDTLLHLTGILGAKNDHLLFGEVDSDGSGRGHTLSPSVGRERSGIVNDIVGMEMLELLPVGSDKHVAHEQSMVGTCADNTDVDAVAFIPASITVDHVDAISCVEIVDCSLSVDSPDLTDSTD